MGKPIITSKHIVRSRIGRIMSRCTDFLAAGERELTGAEKGTLSLNEFRLRSDFNLRTSTAQLGDLAFEQTFRMIGFRLLRLSDPLVRKSIRSWIAKLLAVKTFNRARGTIHSREQRSQAVAIQLFLLYVRVKSCLWLRCQLFECILDRKYPVSGFS